MKNGVVNISVDNNGDLLFAHNNKTPLFINEHESNSPIKMAAELCAFYSPIKELVLMYGKLKINMSKFVGLGKAKQM